MASARAINWRVPAATHETLLGLLAVTGMRVGEALRLEPADIDRDNAVIVIRESKFGNYAEHAVMPSPVVKALSGALPAWESSA